jgi:tetratricopeptide (TPR) repeat protein
LHASYVAAFQELGIDVENLSAEEAAAKLRECSAVEELATFLDDWSWLLRPVVGRRCPASDPLLWDKLTDIALLADPDEWRNRFRRADRDTHARDTLVRAAAVEAETVDLPAPTLRALASNLRRVSAPVYRRAVLRRAYLRYPQDYWINRQLAEFLTEVPGMAARTRRHRSAEALAHLRAALALRPDDTCTMSDLAGMLLRQGDHEAAEALARRSLQFAPAHAVHYATLAAALRARGDREQAIDTYRRAIALDPKSGRSHGGLAACLASLGEHEQAAEHYRRAVDLAPGDAEVLRWAADFFANCADLGLRDPAFAVTLAERAVERSSTERASYHVCGMVLYRAGRYEDALKRLEQAARLAWSEVGPREWYWLAMVHERLGRHAEAEEWFAKAERAIAEREPAGVDLATLRAEARAVLGKGEGR